LEVSSAKEKNRWTREQFEEANWENLNLALKNKADMYKIWRSKQASGFCGTRIQVGIYSGEKYPDGRCPNCGTKETDAHLMRCPNEDFTCLLIDNADELTKWLKTDSRTDPELVYWIPKYILMRDDKPFLLLG
jgi:hypothetical protein